jgi:uncharacterized membrane protein YfhO
MDQISLSIPQKYKFEMGFSFLIVTDLFFIFFQSTYLDSMLLEKGITRPC